MSDYRTLGEDDVIKEGDVAIDLSDKTTLTIASDNHAIGKRVGHFKLYEFRRPIKSNPSEPPNSSEGETCHLCRLPVSHVSGDPGLWPVYFCHGDDSGVAKSFHTKCVSGSISDLDRLRAELVEARREAEQVKFQWDAETCERCNYMRSPVAPCKCGQLVSRGTNNHLRTRLAAAEDNVRKANANHEKFERLWYLERDAKEAAEKERDDLSAQLDTKDTLEILDMEARQAVIDGYLTRAKLAEERESAANKRVKELEDEVAALRKRKTVPQALKGPK